MRVLLLPSARRDLRWFRHYYERVFREGSKNAAERYGHALQTLKSQPNIGHPSLVAGLREFSIPRTPFLLIYRVRADRIEILRVFDERSER